MQAELEAKYLAIEDKNRLRWVDQIPVDLDDPKGQAQIKDYIFRIIAELIEASECLKNKPWKSAHMPTDRNHFLEELSDFFHFAVALFLLVGLDAEQMYRLYWAKQEVNRFRIESNY